VAYLLRRKLKKLCFSLKRNKHPLLVPDGTTTPEGTTLLMARPHQKEQRPDGTTTPEGTTAPDGTTTPEQRS